MAKKNCKQVNIPVVDNSKDECEFFVSSECVAVDRKSMFIKNVYGDDLNEYLELLENKLRRMELQIKKLEKIVKYITVNLPEIGIGIYEEE